MRTTVFFAAAAIMASFSFRPAEGLQLETAEAFLADSYTAEPLLLAQPDDKKPVQTKEKATTKKATKKTTVKKPVDPRQKALAIAKASRDERSKALDEAVAN